MENSIDYARYLSLQEDNDMFFNHSCVKATTKYNNGRIMDPTTTYVYTNKCILNAISDAVGKNLISPTDLLDITNFKNDNMFDTDIPSHRKMIATIAEIFDLKIEIYIGRQKKNVWYTTPYATHTIGNGTIIVRILNKRLHFEHLVRIENGFPKNPRETERLNIIKQQKELLLNCKLYY